jgi:uncharacterized protein involved in exopolysaccharide biosynthesis
MGVLFADMRQIAGQCKLVLLLFSLGLLLVLAGWLLMGKKEYRAEARLLVSFSREVSDARGRELVRTAGAMLLNDDSLLAAAQRITGNQHSLQDTYRLQQYLAKRFTLTVVPDTDIIDISFDFPDPLVAQRVLGLVLGQYFAEVTPKPSAVVAGAAGADAPTAVNPRKAASPVQPPKFSPPDNQRLLLLRETRDHLQIALNALSSDFAYTQRKCDVIKELLLEPPDELLNGVGEVMNDDYVALTERLATAAGRRETLLRRLRPEHAEIQALNEEIRGIQRDLRQEPKQVPDADEVETRYAAAREYLTRQLLEIIPEAEAQKARMENLRQQLRDVDAALARSAESQDSLAALRESLEAASSVSGTVSDDTVSASRARDIYPARVSLLSGPSSSPVPVSPGWPQALAIALACLLGGNLLLLGGLSRIARRETVAAPHAR